MADRFVARLPDGSESRLAWFLWMGGAFVFYSSVVRSALQAVDALPFVLETLGARQWSVEFLARMSGAIAVLLIVAVLAALMPFARKRLLMPTVAWIAMAVVPLALWVLTALAAALVGGSALVLNAAAVATMGLALGWLGANVARDEGSGGLGRSNKGIEPTAQAPYHAKDA